MELYMVRADRDWHARHRQPWRRNRRPTWLPPSRRTPWSSWRAHGILPSAPASGSPSSLRLLRRSPDQELLRAWHCGRSRTARPRPSPLPISSASILQKEQNGTPRPLSIETKKGRRSLVSTTSRHPCRSNRFPPLLAAESGVDSDDDERLLRASSEAVRPRCCQFRLQRCDELFQGPWDGWIERGRIETSKADHGGESVRSALTGLLDGCSILPSLYLSDWVRLISTNTRSNGWA